MGYPVSDCCVYVVLGGGIHRNVTWQKWTKYEDLIGLVWIGQANVWDGIAITTALEWLASVCRDSLLFYIHVSRFCLHTREVIHIWELCNMSVCLWYVLRVMTYTELAVLLTRLQLLFADTRRISNSLISWWLNQGQVHTVNRKCSVLQI
jgi:hypothetical protein